MAYRLRILSGKHEGAELPLTARRYSLGSSEDNALILSDDAIAEHHMSFFFADDELSVLRAPGGLRIDGKKVENFPVDVAPFQIMTLAGSNEKDNISLAYGNGAGRGEDSEASTDEATFTETDKKKATIPTLRSQVPALRSWPDHARIAALLASGGASAEPKVRQAEKRLGALSRLSPKRKKLLVRSSVAIVVLASVTVLVIVASLLWQDPARQQATRMRQVEEALETELKAKPIAERTVHIEQAENGSITLTGYVETEKELVRLRGLAFESGLLIRVVSKEQLRAALEVIARQYGLFANFYLFALDEDEEHASMRTPKTQLFRLRLEGLIEHEVQLEEFRESVRRDLPYITQIDTDITTSEAILARMRHLLSGNAAFGGVELTLEEGHLLLQGAIFANFHDELRSLLKHHYRSLPYHPLTKDRLTLVPPLHANITALLLGRQRAVDLRLRRERTSKRYRIGERIDLDKTIVAIASNGILLSYLDQIVGLPIAALAEPLTHEEKTNKTTEEERGFKVRANTKVDKKRDELQTP